MLSPPSLHLQALHSQIQRPLQKLSPPGQSGFLQKKESAIRFRRESFLFIFIINMHHLLAVRVPASLGQGLWFSFLVSSSVLHMVDTQLKLNKLMHYSFLSFSFLFWTGNLFNNSHLFQSCNKMLTYIKIKFREKKGPISNVFFSVVLSLVFPLKNYHFHLIF